MLKNLVFLFVFSLVARAGLGEIIDLGGDDWLFNNHENSKSD